MIRPIPHNLVTKYCCFKKNKVPRCCNTTIYLSLWCVFLQPKQYYFCGLTFGMNEKWKPNIKLSFPLNYTTIIIDMSMSQLAIGYFRGKFDFVSNYTIIL